MRTWSRIGASYWLTAGFTLVFVLGNFWSATRLTFYWDDYDIILNESRLGFSSIFYGNMGHVGLLTKIIFFGATHVFGLWYPGYILLNILFISATLWFALLAVSESFSRRGWLRPAVAAIYFFCIGISATVQVAICLEWFVSAALASAAALAASRGRSPWLWAVLLGCSWLSMSALFPVNVALFGAVWLFTTRSVTTAAYWRRAAIVGGMLVLGFLAAMVGAWNASRLTTPYYAGADGTSNFSVDGRSIGTLLDAAHLTTAWTFSPLMLTLTTTATFATTLIIFMAAHELMFIVGVGIVLIGVLAVPRFLPSNVRGGRVLGGMAWAFALPVAVWALQVAAARHEQMLVPRYMVPVVLPASLLWVGLLSRLGRTRFERMLGVVVAALLGATALVSVLTFPGNLTRAVELDQPRARDSHMQREALSECLTKGSTTPVRRISPGFSGQDVCDVALYLKRVSLQGRFAPDYS